MVESLNRLIDINARKKSEGGTLVIPGTGGWQISPTSRITARW